MRTFLTIASTTLIIAAVLFLVWRPVLGFSLALLGFAVNLWRLSRASRPVRAKVEQPRPMRRKRFRATAPETAEAASPATPVIEAAPPQPPQPAVPAPDAPAPALARVLTAETPAAPANDSQPEPATTFPTEIVTRVLAAGWEAGVRGPVLYCGHSAIRLALIHAGPTGPRAEDVTTAIDLKIRRGAHFVGIVCSQRPDAALTERAAGQGVQFVNAARLEAYLAVASSFKPPQNAAQGHKASA